MNDVPESELLSAYLDGELTSAEQARAEQLLAASPRARQLLDELRALSTTLQSLPQEKLGDDISPQVLRLAERRMLTEPAELPRPAKPRKSKLRRTLVPRALIWSAVAVVVAIVLIWSEQDRRERERPAGERIAQAPKAAAGPEAAPAIHAAPAPEEKSEEERERFHVREMRRGEATSDEATGAPEYRLKATGATASAGSSVAAGKAPSRDKEARKDFVAAGSSEFTMKKPAAPEAANGEKAGGSDAPTGPAQVAASQGIVADQPANGPGADVSLAKSSGSVVGKRLGLPDVKKGKGVAASGGSGYAGKGGGSGLGGGLGRADRGRLNLDGEFARVHGGVLLVQCKISADAAQQKAFDKLLVKNKIVWEDSAVGDGLARQVHSFAYGGEQGGAKHRERLDPVDADKSDSDAGQLQLVYVEATAPQIEATLAELKAKPMQFLSVTVDPGPEATELLQVDAGNALGEGDTDTAAKDDPQGRGSGVLSRDNVSPGRARRIMLPEKKLNANGTAQAPSLNQTAKYQQTLGDRVGAANERVPAAPQATTRGPTPAKRPPMAVEPPAPPAESPASPPEPSRAMRASPPPLQTAGPAAPSAPADQPAKPGQRPAETPKNIAPAGEKPADLRAGQKLAPVEGLAPAAEPQPPRIATAPPPSQPGGMPDAVQQGQQPRKAGQSAEQPAGGGPQGQPEPTYRVLFVLRVVPTNPAVGDISARKAEVLKENEAKAKQAAKAEHAAEAAPAAQAK